MKSPDNRVAGASGGRQRGEATREQRGTEVQCCNTVKSPENRGWQRSRAGRQSCEVTREREVQCGGG